MNIADRIQNLRKVRGISQEELADAVGVSRQAVSKWESEQSMPDLEKILLLSEYFDVTTDYLLKGIEQKADNAHDREEKPDARIFCAVATMLNFIGLIAALLVWFEEQTVGAVAVGFIIMAVGCMVFVIGQLIGEHQKVSARWFAGINVWLLTLMPLSCAFNVVQGVLGRFSWMFSPVPELGNSILVYLGFWLVYVVVCACVDIVIAKRR